MHVGLIGLGPGGQGWRAGLAGRVGVLVGQPAPAVWAGGAAMAAWRTGLAAGQPARAAH